MQLAGAQVLFVPPSPVHPHIYSNGHICLDILYDGAPSSVPASNGAVFIIPAELHLSLLGVSLAQCMNFTIPAIYQASAPTACMLPMHPKSITACMPIVRTLCFFKSVSAVVWRANILLSNNCSAASESGKQG